MATKEHPTNMIVAGTCCAPTRNIPVLLLLLVVGCVIGLWVPTTMAFSVSIRHVMGRRAARHVYSQTISPRTRIQNRHWGIVWRGAASSSSSSDNTNNSDNPNYEREFAQKQKAMSSDLKKKKTSTSVTTTESQFTKHQARVFDEMASFFASDDAIPDDVIPVLEDMTAAMMSRVQTLRTQTAAQNAASRPARAHATATYDQNVYRILDVGCGTGALFAFYLQAAEAQDMTLQIHGLDLAPNMVVNAQEHAAKVLSQLKSDRQHSIVVEVGDIGNWKPPSQQDYDLVVANACFGNFWDPAQALQQMTQTLRHGGLLCIAHPLGSPFVQHLHDEDATTVPHVLPTTPSHWHSLARTLPLQLLEIVDRPDDPYYLASATKVSYHILPQTMRLRGTVDTGYGRGGKKLGFPTANLPSRLFQGALADVPCGVYFGWAVLEDTGSGKAKKGRNSPHKAVVNVGFSPTFEGQENPEKIVEAHLMLKKKDDDDDASSVLDPPDFYGEVMRLQLHGYIRPEMKFPSFPDLIAQISTDVEDAKDALDLDVSARFQQDSFLLADNSSSEEVWIGQSGGDATASWDCEDVESVLDKL